ncbi:MAG: DUF2807 domain-containing protein [Bacteroidetes bacterium]|nr:DUF2807 domain-containing protein [Bacteroidota bacterium]HET6245970.1 head GIN domain-containing protein [Bacteroidia bacterium]
MKTFYYILFSFSLILFSCKKENMNDCVKSTGEIITEHRAVNDFDSILVHNNITLYLKYDSVSSIVVEAGKNLVPLVETSIENNKLIIRNNNRCNFMRSYKPPVNVIVSISDLKHLNLAGSGDIFSLNTLVLERVRMVNSGIGDINLEIDAGYLYTQIYGSGGINLSGKAAVSEIYSTGNCFMQCENLVTGYTYLHSNTTGNIYVNVEKELGVNIIGSGDVYYLGKPDITKLNITGKGTLKNLN